jgi:chromosome segregation ATPase
MAAIIEDAELKGLKQRLEKAQARLKEVDKEVNEGLPYHIEQIERQLARMKGLFEGKGSEPKKKVDLLGNHGEIIWSLDKVKKMLEDLEEAVKDVKRLEEDVEEYEKDLKEEQEEKNAAIVASAMKKRPSQI